MCRYRAVPVLLALVVVVAGCGGSAEEGADRPCPSSPGAPARLVPEVVRSFPHATDAFTEGLLVAGGTIWESTGLEGRSTLRALDARTGAEQRRAALPAAVFGEGLALRRDGRLVQLTWKDGRAFVWDRKRLTTTGELTYDGEGWGLSATSDGRFVMSNGSDTLTVRDPMTFRPVRSVKVVRPGGGTDQLNELEVDGGSVWANRFQTTEILRIDLACGTVTGTVDATGLVKDAQATAAAAGVATDVLNGIAKVPGTDHFLVTGKYWPKVYEVRFRPA